MSMAVGKSGEGSRGAAKAGPAQRTLCFGETIFSEMTALARQHGAVNLGQGFPDFEPPEFVLRAATSAVEGGDHQYARGSGHPALVEALAAELGPSFGRALDPLAEITVTVGATEGLFASVLALCDPGDEVILIEPFYDSYPADVLVAGGTLRYVPLRPQASGRWELDPDELRAAFGARTKLILLNTPHNPCGKVFSREELQLIAGLCQEHGVFALSDEVYERIFFDEQEHVRLATLPGMWERTLTIGSAGKTFSVTGWKIGWVIGNPELSTAVRRIHQWIPFAVATPLQLAVAQVLRAASRSGYYAELRASYQQKRDRLVGILREAGLQPLVPEGAYFVIADGARFGLDDDVALCRHLTTQVGVAAIPPSSFYSEEHRALARRKARFCFCKRDETLSAAAARFARLERDAEGAR
jgi:N-succinyldiaminopimelate aminotransferase